LGKFDVSLLPSSAKSTTKSATVVRVGPQEDGAIVFVIDPVPEVTIPCRIVVVTVSGEFVIVDDSGRRGVDRSRSVDRETNSYAYNSRMSESNVAEAGAGVYLRIALGSDEAAGYDGCEDKYLFHNCKFLS
jgi:hypothetical protein